MKTMEISTIRLDAEDGMILTDGEIYGRTIFLGRDREVSEFYEITQEEYNTIMKEEESEIIL